MPEPNFLDTDRSQLLQSNLRWNLSRWAVTHQAFVGFLMIACSIAGLVTYWQMGRAEDPSFTIKTALVGAVWPGATADEMQRYVAKKIEDKLRETPKLEFLLTYCISDRMMTLVQLQDSVRGRDVASTWYQVRKKLDDIRGELPASLIGPTVDDEYGDVYSAVYMFTGDEYSLAELKRIAQQARTRLLKVKDVEKVDIIGEQQEQILLEFSHRKLATLGVTPQQIFDSVARQSVMLRSGSVDTDEDRIHVRVDRSFSGIEQIEAVPVEASGRVFRLGDVAKVTRSYETPPSFLARYNGKPAVGIGVVMQKGGNVLELGKALTRQWQTIGDDIPAGVEVNTVAFQPQVVKASVGEFLKSFLEALVIVLIVSFLSLGMRTGIVVALSVPLVLAISLVVMHSMGMNLDRITLGALILSLGLLVDDAIIAVEMMAVKMEQGWSRLDAATFAWTSTAFPMFSGTLITVAGFLPVVFARSTSGEYAGGIFWVVGITLVTSWLVAVLFTPLLGMRLLPEPQRGTSNRAHGASAHQAFDSPFHRVLRGMVRAAVTRPWLVVSLTFGLFLLAVLGMTRLQQQFFPRSSRPELLVDVRMNEGSSIGATSEMLRKIESKLEPMLLSDSKPTGPIEVLYYTSYVGAGSARFFLALNPDLPNPSFGKIVIQTSSIASRERLRRMLKETFQNDPEFSAASMRVLRLDFGPPVGYPVQFRVVGPEKKVVRQWANQVREVMRKNPSAVDVNLECEEPAKTIQVKIDQDLGPIPAGDRTRFADAPKRHNGIVLSRRDRGAAGGGSGGRSGAAQPGSVPRHDALYVGRQERSAAASRPFGVFPRGSHRVAAQSGTDPFGAVRYRRWSPGSGCEQADRSGDRRPAGRTTSRVPHRFRWKYRGEQQSQRGSIQHVPDHDFGHADGFDGTGSKFPKDATNLWNRPIGDHRRGRFAASVSSTVWIRGFAGRDRLGWHGHAKLGDLGRSDRAGHPPGAESLASGDRILGAACKAGDFDSGHCHSRHGPSDE